MGKGELPTAEDHSVTFRSVNTGQQCLLHCPEDVASMKSFISLILTTTLRSGLYYYPVVRRKLERPRVGDE